MKNLVLILAVALVAPMSFAQTKEGIEKCVEKKEKETGFIEKRITTRETREKVYTRECYTEAMREKREKENGGD